MRSHVTVILGTAVSLCLAGVAAHDLVLAHGRFDEAAAIRALSSVRRQPLTLRALDLCGEPARLAIRRPSRDRGVTVVVGMSGGCQACADAAPSLATLLENVGANMPVEQVHLVAFGSEADTQYAFGPIERVVPRQSVVSRIRIAEDPLAFSVRTGLLGVPFFIVADDDGAIRELMVGIPERNDIRLITRRIATSAPAAGIYPNVTMRPYFHLDRPPRSQP